MKLTRLFATACLLLPSLLMAQAQGRIKGTVVDTTGKAIPEAKIVMTCPEIANYHRELKTDDKGTFATLVVDATRKYMFHVEAPGFQPVEQEYKPLIGGQTLEIGFTLTRCSGVISLSLASEGPISIPSKQVWRTFWRL